jgi:hypothetical protein
MDEDSITSFLESVVKDEIEKKIIKMISEDVPQEKMLDVLLNDIQGGKE